MDLIVVGEWMPITIFENREGILQSPFSILNSSGLWNSITSGDFDQDSGQLIVFEKIRMMDE